MRVFREGGGFHLNEIAEKLGVDRQVVRNAARFLGIEVRYTENNMPIPLSLEDTEDIIERIMENQAKRAGHDPWKW